jgi:hypothetical protein
MRVRRFRFLPQIDFLSSRVVPSAGPVGAAIPPAVVSGNPAAGSSPNLDPMGPGGPAYVDMTHAIAIAPCNAYN